MSVEPGFELVDEGLGARIDPNRPATIRAHVPALDDASIRRATETVESALGHLQAFGLRPIGDLRTRVVDEDDWAEAWKQHFHVQHLGRRLVIKPSWLRYRRAGDEVVIDLDPGMAFGTGLHPTTRLCLQALEDRADRGPLGRVLDVGCGSGILSIAAVKLGATRALGVDIDPIAIEATEANARHNRVGRRVRAREGSIPSDAGPVRHGPREPDRGDPRRARAAPRGGGRARRHARDLGHLHRPRGGDVGRAGGRRLRASFGAGTSRTGSRFEAVRAR